MGSSPLWPLPCPLPFLSLCDTVPIYIPTSHTVPQTWLFGPEQSGCCADCAIGQRFQNCWIAAFAFHLLSAMKLLLCPFLHVLLKLNATQGFLQPEQGFPCTRPGGKLKQFADTIYRMRGWHSFRTKWRCQALTGSWLSCLLRVQGGRGELSLQLV